RSSVPVRFTASPGLLTRPSGFSLDIKTLLTPPCQQHRRRFWHRAARCGPTREEAMLQPSVPAWFEIPSADFERAVRFYETVLETRLTREEMGPMTMGVFPHQKPGTSGAVVKGPGYVANESGTVVYLSLDDIRPAISRVGAAG